MADEEDESQSQWEEAQTEPLLGSSSNNGRPSIDNTIGNTDGGGQLSSITHRTSLDNSSSTMGRTSLDSTTTTTINNYNNGRASINNSTFDADATLPLPPEVQSQVDGESLLKMLTTTPSNGNGNNGSGSRGVSESEAASLLSHLTQLSRSNSSWNATHVQLVKVAVQSAMVSLNNNIERSNGNATTETNESSSSGDVVVAMMEPKMARRILSDGIMPLASSFNNSVDDNSNNSNSSSNDSNNNGGTPSSVWVAKLIRSIVVEDLLPTAFVGDDNNGNINGSGEGEGGNRNNNTNQGVGALEILLGTFLTRMDADEANQTLLPPIPTTSSSDTNANEGGGVYTVDDILDRLCNVTTRSGNGVEDDEGDTNTTNQQQQQQQLRPAATAAILASLRELETNFVEQGGRLSKRRVWKTIHASKSSSGLQRRGGTTNHNDQGKRRKVVECHFEYIDRPTHLLQAGLDSLKMLASTTSTSTSTTTSSSYGGQYGDPEALPPLVYQLGLTPMGLATGGAGLSAASGSGSGGNNNKSNKGENAKQRGMRLRRMCLEGIASVLDDDHVVDVDATTISVQEEAAWRYAKYTSLSHLGNTLRSDPEMTKAVLGMLAGDKVLGIKKSVDQAPFRYKRLTPYKLAIGLSMASAVPRTRSSALSTICELILQEETLRIKRGLGVDGNSEGAGSTKPWMDCLVRCLEYKSSGGDANSSSNGGSSTGQSSEQHHHHVLRCLLTVAKFAESEHQGGGLGGGGSGSSMSSAGSLLQSLTQLGFLLVDCVKKDNKPSTEANILASPAVLTPTFEISDSSNGPGGNSSTNSATHATASTGRYLLSYLFYQSSHASLASQYSLTSSLASSNTGGNDCGTALCRSILRTCLDKFCGMAPNAKEHSLLLLDLLSFDPLASQSLVKEKEESIGDNNEINTGLDDKQKQLVISLAMATYHLPALIDTLSNIPGGGLAPTVASTSIIPTLGHTMMLQATLSSTQAQRATLGGLAGIGSLWKRSDLEDHVDHAFLLSKKSLFSNDVEKRIAAAKLLVTLLGVAAVASSTTSSRGGGRSGSSAWNSILYDMKGCLRRCLTQHSSAVQTEVYSSLMSLLPSGGSSNNDNLSANSQDSASPGRSPASSTTSGATPQKSTSLNIYNDNRNASALSPVNIPTEGKAALVDIVSELLHSSLERYVTVPNEERSTRDARRKRSAMGVGLSQMEMAVEEESPDAGKDGDEEEEKTNPWRFDKCIFIPRHHAGSILSGGDSGKKKKGKAAKSQPMGQALLTEALNRINEPLTHLITSCITAAPLANEYRTEVDIEDDDMGNEIEIKQTINRIRKQMARCDDIDAYLKWIKSNKRLFEFKDNAIRTQEIAICKLATLIIVAGACDVLMATSDWSASDNEGSGGGLVIDVMGNGADEESSTIEDLFILRTDAVRKAASIMSSLVASKPAKKSKKKLKEKNENQADEVEDKQPKKKKSKSSSAEETGATIMKIKDSDISDGTRSKNQKLVEDALLNICPAMAHQFLTNSLRSFGGKKTCDDDSDDDEQDEDKDAATRLASCVDFRRFVITKSLLLMSGSSHVVRVGSRFSSLASHNGNQSAVIPACMTLAPLLLVEFCAASYDLDQTSIQQSSSASQSNGVLSMAQLAMRSFASCLRGMVLVQHPSLSKASRVHFLLSSAIAKASSVFGSKDGWAFYQDLDSFKPTIGMPNDQLQLMKTLSPFISLPLVTEAGDKVVYHHCLFQELLNNGMVGESHECVQLVSAVAEAFSEPNLKENLGVMLLRAWELGSDDGEHAGVLNLDHGDDSGVETTCVSTAINVAMKLNSGLAGNTTVPLPRGLWSGKYDDLRVDRSKLGLPMTSIENWPEKHQGRLAKTLKSTSGIVGIGPQVIWAFSVQVGIGEEFVPLFDASSPTRKQLKMNLMKAAVQSSSSITGIANTICGSIDDALNNADFVALKLIPHMSDESLDMAQRFLSCLLFSVAKAIGPLAQSAENLDAGFASTQLKSTKRLYGIATKLVLSFMDSPEESTSNETKDFLEYLSDTLIPHISTLLFILQKQQETATGKFLAESKIESQGKSAALLVFAKETLDNALLKLGAKLKQAGLEDESEWLEERVVSTQAVRFGIKSTEAAREREAPKKKRKAKIKSEPTEKKSKKKKRAIEEDEAEEEGDAADEGSVMESIDAGSDDGSDVVDLDKLTAEMEEEEDEEDSENDDDDEDEESEEEEAEFD